MHAQGIIHRDIKPDNCLITDDDVLKIVDFGVSEMFEKESEMLTTKSAGSPAFMPPELCVAKHGPVSGKAADIWSMGVTLYCLRFGRIPFEKQAMLDLFESIRHDDPEFEEDCDPDLRDLLSWILEKNPDKRLTMDQIRVCGLLWFYISANCSSRSIHGSRGAALIHYYRLLRTLPLSSSLLPTRKSMPPLPETWVI